MGEVSLLWLFALARMLWPAMESWPERESLPLSPELRLTGEPWKVELESLTEATSASEVFSYLPSLTVCRGWAASCPPDLVRAPERLLGTRPRVSKPLPGPIPNVWC